MIIIAKGNLSKTLIGESLLQIFPGSFIDSDRKTVRIPTTCEGEPLEIKITMTCAKDLVGGAPVFTENVSATAEQQNRAMTDEEIAEVRDLIARMGI